MYKTSWYQHTFTYYRTEHKSGVYPAEHVHQVVEGVRLCVRVEPRTVVPRGFRWLYSNSRF